MCQGLTVVEFEGFVSIFEILDAQKDLMESKIIEEEGDKVDWNGWKRFRKVSKLCGD